MAWKSWNRPFRRTFSEGEAGPPQPAARRTREGLQRISLSGKDGAAEAVPAGGGQVNYLPDEANASNSLLIILHAISNCSGGRLLRRSDMLWASFPVPSSKRIESLEIESVSQMRINVPIEIPTTPRSISETFFVARETSSANLSCVRPADSLAIRIWLPILTLSSFFSRTSAPPFTISLCNGGVDNNMACAL